MPFFRPHPSGKKGQARAQFTYRNIYKVSFSQSISVRLIFHIIDPACFQRHENGKDKLDVFSYSIFHAKFPVSIFFQNPVINGNRKWSITAVEEVAFHAIVL